MGNIWGGKKWRPADMPKKQPKINQSIEELLKPLSEKNFKGNVWGSQIMNVEKETTTPIVSPSPTPTVTPTQSVTPSITPSVTPSISVTPTPTPTMTPTPSASPIVLVVNQVYQGGRIAYILQSGDPGYDANVQHGLIMTTGNTSSSAQFGCQGTNITGTTSTFGSGPTNTQKIVEQCGTAGIAARVCNDLVQNGYSDWYLPSLVEWNKINGYYSSNLLPNLNLAVDTYWTSTQINTTQSWVQDTCCFATGNPDGKSNSRKVRAIRSF